MERLKAVLRWWFENRHTGKITVAQFPNLPLFAVAIVWVVGRVARDGSMLADIAAVLMVGLWIFWGSDELIRGVNPWRRLLGAAVIAWQVIGLLG